MMGKNDSAVLKTLDGTTMPLMCVKAHGTLAGALFEMTVEQRYRNNHAINIEAIYTFPLACSAVLLGVEFELNGKTSVGVAVEKLQAERLYEDAIEDGNSAILLEESGDGLYTINLGNLMPGEEAVVRYRYGQMLAWEQDSLRLIIPTTIAPRYGDPQSQGLQPHQTPVEDAVVEYPLLLEIDVRGELAYRQISSPTHRLKSQLIDGGMRLTLGQATLDRDIVLTLLGGATSVVHVARDNGGWVALAAYCPMISDANTGRPVSLRVVIDCSGSMDGVSILSARRGALKVIEDLRPEDEFSVTRFGTSHTHLFDELMPANTKNALIAHQFLQSTVAGMGGTEMVRALQSASQLPAKYQDGNVLLITDGDIWDDGTMIESALRSGLRYFVVGVGTSPSHQVLSRLAMETGGAYEAVTPGQDIEAAIVHQFRRMRQTRARCLRITWPSTEQWATDLPNTLFNGDTVHAFAGFQSEPHGGVRLLYSLDDGTSKEEHADIQAWPSDSETLARLAAAMRIRQSQRETEMIELCTNLATRYNLVTNYTHYVVVQEPSESDKPDDLPMAVKVRQMVAAGWGGMPSDRPTIWRCRRSSQVLEHQSMTAISGAEPELVTTPTLIRPNRNPRKSTDQSKGSISLKGQIPQFLANLDQRLNAGRGGGVPSKISSLAALGLPHDILMALERLVSSGFIEARVVLSFFQAILEMGWINGTSANCQAKLREFLVEGSNFDEILVLLLLSDLDSLQS